VTTLNASSETKISAKPSEWIQQKRKMASIGEAAREIREHLMVCSKRCGKGKVGLGAYAERARYREETG